MTKFQSALGQITLFGLIVLIWSHAPAFAKDVDAIPKSGPNCSVLTPPDASGEDAGIALFKVFPRKGAVAENYTGCQTIWMQTSTLDYQRRVDVIAWVKVNVMYFENGKLRTSMMGGDLDRSEGGICRFTNGELDVGQDRSCKMPFDGGLMPTFAPGCMSKALEVGKMSEECSRSKG